MIDLSSRTMRKYEEEAAMEEARYYYKGSLAAVNHHQHHQSFFRSFSRRLRPVVAFLALLAIVSQLDVGKLRSSLDSAATTATRENSTTTSTSEATAAAAAVAAAEAAAAGRYLRNSSTHHSDSTTQSLKATATGVSKRKHIPCQLLLYKNDTYNQHYLQASPYSQYTRIFGVNETDHASRFAASNWTCFQDDTTDYYLATLEFQIRECPPYYSSSTFQLQASTQKSRVMGHVSDRLELHDGCGYYNATVSVMDFGKPITIDLFWTSIFKHYSNHPQDVQDAFHVKQENLYKDEYAADKLAAVFSQERLDYLDRHLDRLPGFPLHLQLSSDKDYNSFRPNNLPDCGTIPLQDWLPAVGVYDGPVNDTSHLSPPDEAPRWPFRSARCQFVPRTLPQLNELFAGITVKWLGDSHGTELYFEAKHITCPELKEEEEGTYINGNYHCPYRNNTFLWGYRFFRGVFADATFTKDFDGISKSFRQGDHTPELCQELLGVGSYNATIIMIPHWIFVYETQEGMNDFLLATKNLLENCRTHFPDEMEHHLVLLQSASARDCLPSIQSAPAVSWRGIHNHRIEAFSQQMTQELGPYIDGIIPFFEFSWARIWDIRTHDGVHMPKSTYRDMFHMQVAAIRSAMKYRRGLELPIMSMEDPQARWFAPATQPKEEEEAGREVHVLTDRSS